jgi:hypothetical protein
MLAPSPNVTTPRNLQTGAEKKERKKKGWEQRHRIPFATHLTDRSTDEWPSFMRTDVADKMSGTSIFNAHQWPSLMSEWSGKERKKKGWLQRHRIPRSG